ncbi:MAG: 4Fe-4S dicluster domain-containing protein [Rhodobacteraceae bacterium]|nr:4Fe-4S dicluster domain-containing protein [Paracoccaceae bacterium]
MTNPSKKPKGAEISRRDILKSGAALATLTLAPGVTLMAFGGKASASEDMPADGLKPGARWGLLIDAGKCPEDCSACVAACSTEQGWENNGLDTDPQWIRKVTLKETATGRTNSLPVMCQHCENPPCVDVCPTGASFKREDGIVLVNRHTCIGCRYCMMACPFKARSFVAAPVTGQKSYSPRGVGTVEGCNLCVHKIDRGDGTTACVEACTATGNNAMMFGDLNDPQSEIAIAVATYASQELRADLGLGLGVRYQNI